MITTFDKLFYSMLHTHIHTQPPLISNHRPMLVGLNKVKENNLLIEEEENIFKNHPQQIFAIAIAINPWNNPAQLMVFVTSSYVYSYSCMHAPFKKLFLVLFFFFVRFHSNGLEYTRKEMNENQMNERIPKWK